ncbi:MAG TPA: hypothetical protein VEC35_11240 [Noviherbaspirillum sp.]|nr:hypothetical protein [Noviherbaspirillum sp.]
MNIRIFIKALLVALVSGSIFLYIMRTPTPPWMGPFTGKRVVIQKDIDPTLTASWVFADLVNFQKSFQLTKGDDCFVLTAPEWRWKDAKAGLSFVPVFCPGKGAGWSDPQLLDG